jgi:hypothetical protein
MHEYFLIKKLLVKIFMGKSFTISLEHFTGDLNVYVTNDDPHVYVMLTDDLNVYVMLTDDLNVYVMLTDDLNVYVMLTDDLNVYVMNR